MDVAAIGPGVDFAEEISRAVAACTVLLAVIGPNWLTATDEQGRRRLDDPRDSVRLEIEAALARDMWVIPTLVEGAKMPRRQDLPESLGDLARRNALLIRHESFRSDAERLITAIMRALTATDPDRAARLLTEAEHVAHSITDEPAKASALSAVAKALAATDPDRAALLFTEAEHVAHSITRRIREGIGAKPYRGGTDNHRSRPRRAHRPLHHHRAHEGMDAERHGEGTGSHVAYALIPYLQNTPRLSDTVAHLGLRPHGLGRDRLVSDAVVVRLGGQTSWLLVGAENLRDLAGCSADRSARRLPGGGMIFGLWA